MRFLLIAVLFLFTVAVFTVLAKYGYQSSVEAELEQRSSKALRAAGFDGVVATFDHLNANLEGDVASEAEKAEVVALLEKAVPTAYLPPPDETSLTIRPSLPPWISVRREGGETAVALSGKLGADEDRARRLLGAKIHALDAIEGVDNAIELDAKRLPFPTTAEFAALAAGLVGRSDDAEITLKDEILTLSGEVENDGLKTSLIELAEKLDAREIVDEIRVAEPLSFRKPTTLTITRNRFGLTLSGTLASEQGRERVRTLVERAEGAEGADRITDRLEVGESFVPAAWEEHVEAIVPLLIAECGGEMTAAFSREKVRLEGTVASEKARRQLMAAVRPLKEEQPSLDILANLAVDDAEEEPEIRILAVYRDGLLTLDGSVPDDSFVDDLNAALSAADSEILVKNSLLTSPSAASVAWVPRLAEFFTEALARIENGVFSFGYDSLRMEGETVDLADKRILENVAVNTVPGRFSIENLLSHPDDSFPRPALRPEARTRLSESLKSQPIYFDSNSEVVRSDEEAKIEKIAEVVKEAEAPVALAVTGFADNVGNPEYNRALSLRRADAVAKKLVALGLREDSMQTASVGEDVSNVSRSDRWKARRVEVSLNAEEESPSGEE
ncbi:MAG: OmpA family protein [Verrucomicrobiales bacterium]